MRRSEEKHIFVSRTLTEMSAISNHIVSRAHGTHTFKRVLRFLTFLVPPWNEVILKDRIKISIILYFEGNRMRRSEEKHIFVSRTLTEMSGISN